MNSTKRMGLVALTLLSACGETYGAGPLCQAITLQTSPASLPLQERAALYANAFRQSEPFIAGSAELGCCVPAYYFTPAKTDCSAVDCEALRSRLSVAHVGGEYENEPCGPWVDPITPPQGVGSCNVYLDGETIVGVRAYCHD